MLKAYEIIRAKEVKGGAIFAAIIEGNQYAFVGNMYLRSQHNITNWKYGVCPICGNVDGRTSINDKDYCFCMMHWKVWEAGINYKENWYTEEMAEQNARFLENFENCSGTPVNCVTPGRKKGGKNGNT